MKEEITRIKGKILTPLLLSILLIASVHSVTASPEVVVSVDPSYLEVDIGETKTVNITISNVEDPGICGYELKLYYNETLVNATGAIYPTGHFFDVASKFEVPPIFENDTYGHYVHLSVIKLIEMIGETGSGILANVNFTGIGVGGPAPLEIRAVDMLDPNGTSITDYTVDHGSVKVIPEFTSALMIFMFMAITLVVVMLKKLTASEKHNAYCP